MAKINVLDSSIYNRIAAGEVVERPASVVKELVENSIDAGATSIVISIDHGGTREIKIIDNGCGIEKEYIREAFMPHATSKIEKAEDLDSIMTLGFRGEALASIASVARVSMTTKTRDAELGSHIDIEGGKILKMCETGAKDGTTMIISDLFFNVPARAKFLKKPKSEEQEVTALVSRLILANPTVAFRYIVDEKTVFTTPGKTLKEAMYGIYGKEVLTETLPVCLKRDNVEITGYIGRPSYAKANRTYQTLIVNGRHIGDQMISAAVANAYGDMLMKRRYPFFILNLKLPVTDVDVNVHPNKLEVRFVNSNKIFGLFFEAVSRALHEMDYVSSVNKVIEEKEVKQEVNNLFTQSFLKSQEDTQEIVVNNKPTITHDKESEIKINNDKYTYSETRPVINIPKENKKPLGKIDKAGVNLNPFSADFTKMSKDEISDTQIKVIESINKANSEETRVADGYKLGSKLMERLSDAAKKKETVEASSYILEEKIKPEVRYIGKVFNTYLIVELDGDIFFIDQHAGHERLLYEKFKKQVDSAEITIQPLLIPYILTLNATEAGLIEANIPTMIELGFDICEFGNNSFKISAVPSILSEMSFDSFFSEFLRETKFNGTTSELIKEKLMQKSCKAAVKGGNDLTINEVNKLFEDMSNEKIPLFCPHGRPIAIRVSKSEIEKWFKRIV